MHLAHRRRTGRPHAADCTAASRCVVGATVNAPQALLMSLNSESIDVGDDREALLPENDDEQSIQAKRRRSSIVLTGGHAYWQVIFVTIPIFMARLHCCVKGNA